ncbi:MAG: hypothetical protein WC508_00555 [Patescibacteria group bacterium]
MINRKQNFIFRNWHWLVFLFLAFICLAFLLFQRGIWAFADSGFYYQNILEAKKIAFAKLGQFANTDGFYLGFDNSAQSFSHLIISFYQVFLTSIFGSDLGQIIYYFVYYFLCFYFGQKLLKKLFFELKPNQIRLGALFLTFNPFSLLLTTLFTISYIYPLFIIFFYALLNYLDKGKTLNLLLAVFCSLYLFSYLRLIPIVGLTFLFLVWIFYDRINFNLKRLLILAIVVFLCISPFLVGNFQFFGNSSDVVSNYKDSFSKYQPANYNFKQSFVNSLTNPGGFTPSALSFFYNNRGIPGFADNYAQNNTFEFYKFIQLLFNVLLLIAVLFFLKDRRSLKIFITLCFVLFLNTLGNFFSLDFFNEANKTVLIFLYNDYGFLQFVQSFLLAFLLVILFHSFQKKSINHYFNGLIYFIVISYLVINALPFLSNHYGFKKINYIPNDYKQELFTDTDYDFSEATIFAPYHWLHFKWSPYFLDLNTATYSKYKSLLVPNLRFINGDLAKFYNQIYNNFDKDQFQNLAIFNVKSIFVFNDVLDANKNIDTYEVINIENAAKNLELALRSRSDVYLANDYSNFSHFRFNSADDYDFFIYSPKKLFNLNFDNFYNTKLDLSVRPLVFNQSNFNVVNLIDEGVWLNNSPTIDIKAFSNNPNKYYLKLTNLNKNLPFLVQFNQMFSPAWRVYFTDQKEWDSQNCQSGFKTFKLTGNSRCLVDGLAADYDDLKLINKKYLKPQNHFVGNLVGNAFLFEPQDISSQTNKTGEIYLVIYFQKQLYYLICLTISGLTFFVLIVLSLFQVFRQKKIGKHYEKK